VVSVSTIALGCGALFICLVAHELGHLCAGLVVGFRFHLFAIGPLLIERKEAGRIGIGWNRVLSFYGGAVSTLPNKTDGLRRRYAIAVAGGPLASLLVAILAAASMDLLRSAPSIVRSELSWLRLLSALRSWPPLFRFRTAHS
jgi:hypothetical protein